MRPFQRCHPFRVTSMVAMGSRPDTAALAKRFANRFLLRLDNGALLGDGSTLGDCSAPGPILMPADQAFALGRLGLKEASSLESKLQKAHGSVPGAHPLRSVSSGAAKQRRAEVQLSPMAPLEAAGSRTPSIVLVCLKFVATKAAVSPSVFL